MAKEPRKPSPDSDYKQGYDRGNRDKAGDTGDDDSPVSWPVKPVQKSERGDLTDLFKRKND